MHPQNLADVQPYQPAAPPQEVAVPGFTYQFPGKSIVHGFDERIPFAVSPDDPRYYETNEMDADNQASNLNKDYQDMVVDDGNRATDYSSVSNVDGFPSYKIKAPMEVRPKITTPGAGNSLTDKLQLHGKENTIINNGQYLQRSDVIKKHLDLNTVDIYVVAVIAGVSATLTVGLIAIGIAWYT